MKRPPRLLQRVTITLDIVDQPGNDTLALDILNDILRRLDHETATPPPTHPTPNQTNNDNLNTTNDTTNTPGDTMDTNHHHRECHRHPHPARRSTPLGQRASRSDEAVGDFDRVELVVHGFELLDRALQPSVVDPVHTMRQGQRGPTLSVWAIRDAPQHLCCHQRNI